jgi:hypothetical protein
MTLTTKIYCSRQYIRDTLFFIFLLFQNITSFGEGAVKNNRYNLDYKNVLLKMSLVNI